MNVELVVWFVNVMVDVFLVIGVLFNVGIDVFFVNLDNIIFGFFENIIKVCNEVEVFVFISEVGLVD